MTRLVEDQHRCDRAAEVLKALGHPIRIRIIALLCDGECNVGAMAERLGATQPAVSQQLRILRLRELVTVTRVDGFAHYRLAEPKLQTLIQCMESCTFC